MFDQPLAHTYSIVARDPATGELGAAVQSHWFSVGAVVIHAEAEVGELGSKSVSFGCFMPTRGRTGPSRHRGKRFALQFESRTCVCGPRGLGAMLNHDPKWNFRGKDFGFLI